MDRPHLPRALELANDVERNPGPPKVSRNALITPSNKKQSHCSHNGMKTRDEDVRDSVVQTPAPAAIEAPPAAVLTAPIAVEDGGEGLKSVVERQSELLRQQREDLDELRRKLEENTRMTNDFKSELSEIRRNWQSVNNNGENGSASYKKQEESLVSKVDNLASAYNDIQDRLYEIDKSWKNNLVVYGIPCSENMDEDPLVTEEKVRDVLHKKLHISREIAMNRISRIWHGPDFRGHKPIQLCIVNYRDKEEILRKARLLKGSNIYISEDFSRKVREHRHELIKFMKEVRSRDATRRMTLRYDKLYMGNDVFFFNDRSGRVEKIHQHLDLGTSTNALVGNLFINDSQVSSSQHDPSWLRRPRSRQLNLSRQNSISLDDVHSSPSKSSLSHSRSAASARSSRRPVSKSASIDSILDYDSDSAASEATHSARQQHHHHQKDFYYDTTTSPNKTRRVVFAGVPDIDRETERLVNGTPHHRRGGGQSAAEEQDDEGGVMTVDTVARTAVQSFRGDDVSQSRAVAVVRRDDHDGPPLSHSRAVAVRPPADLALRPQGELVMRAPAELAMTPLPPIDYQRYAVPNGYPEHLHSSANTSLPAILHSSIGKLHMNFVQNRSIEAESRHMLRYDEEQREIINDDEERAGNSNRQIQNGRNGHAGSNGIERAGNSNRQVQNGVLKVAMYGEFPMTITKPDSNEQHYH